MNHLLNWNRIRHGMRRRRILTLASFESIKSRYFFCRPRSLSTSIPDLVDMVTPLILTMMADRSPEHLALDDSRCDGVSWIVFWVFLVFFFLPSLVFFLPSLLRLGAAKERQWIATGHGSVSFLLPSHSCTTINSSKQTVGFLIPLIQ